MTTKTISPMLTNYERVKALMNGRPKKKLADNTWAEIDSAGFITITLHTTDIMKLDPDGTIELHSGGWRTDVTLNRMNEYLNERYHVDQYAFKLHQEHGVWKLTKFLSPQWYSGPTKEFVYADGMIIHSDGDVTGAGKPSEEEWAKKVAKLINQYVKAYVAEFLSEDMPAPGGGDCLYCYMFDTNNAVSQTDHLLSHFEEKYYVPSLLTRALEYKPGRISWMTQDCIARIWSADPAVQKPSDWQKSIAERDITSLLKTYLRFRLGLAT
jgi:hypothetical protein